jgi:hypothetical protein
MMQAATSTAPIAAPSHTERAQRHKDGSVLLSVADDRICKLNGVGALTWMVLEDHRGGVSADAVVRELRAQFDAINTEGRLRYDVPQEQLRSDTARFLKQLVTMRLVTREADAQGREFYFISPGVSGTAAIAAAAAKPVAAAKEFSAQDDIRPLKRETLAAFMGLLAFDVLLKIRGFQSLIEKVEHWPTAEPCTPDLAKCRRVRAMVDRAQMYYPKKAMCLQHSAVVTCLLRRRGVPAQMVLGAQIFPAKAHAWVEMEGKVVNDFTGVQNTYQVMRRI